MWTHEHIAETGRDPESIRQDPIRSTIDAIEPDPPQATDDSPDAVDALPAAAIRPEHAR